MVIYLENYGPYVPLVQNGYMDIDVSSYNKDNYEDYFNGILHILRDGIEQEDVQALKLGIHLADGEFIVFTIEDYFFNILFWNAPISRGIPITTKFLIDTRSFTKKTIKKYFDMFIRNIEMKRMKKRKNPVSIYDRYGDKVIAEVVLIKMNNKLKNTNVIKINKDYGIQILVIKRGEEIISNLNEKVTLKEDDVLLVFGTEKLIRKVLVKNNISKKV